MHSWFPVDRADSHRQILCWCGRAVAFEIMDQNDCGCRKEDFMKRWLFRCFFAAAVAGFSVFVFLSFGMINGSAAFCADRTDSPEKDPRLANRNVSLLPGSSRNPLALGARLELFIDDYLIESMNGTRRILHHPRDEGKILDFDNPWEGPSCAYITVFQDKDIIRMYYRGGPTDGKSDNSNEQTCYAESKDGIHWIKPKLGLFEFNGNKNNNIILKINPHFSHNFAPFIDRNPAAAPDQRYKALAGSHQTKLCAFVSADGIHWKQRGSEPVIAFKNFALDSQNVSFWSESEKKYLCYARTWDGFRTVSRCESDDFVHWRPDNGEPMSFGSTNREHIYTNQTNPYFRAPHIYLSTAARFMQGKRIVTPDEAKKIGLLPGMDRDCSESVLMSTRGGSRYDRSFMEALIRPDFDIGNWTSRTNYPACGIIQTGEQEMSIYVQRYYSQPRHCLHRYSIRIDGFVSVNAPYAGGEFQTKLLTFQGKDLYLNMASSAAGSVRLEILNVDGKPVPGFELKNSPDLTGNFIEKKVVWKNNASLEKLVGKPVRIRFVMKDADLWSVRFR